MENYSEEMKRLFEELKDSPLVNEDFPLALSNLCGAIQDIGDSVLGYIDFLERDIKYGLPPNDRIDNLRQRIYRIHTLADIIDSKIVTDDFIGISNLMHEYKKS
ncbi:hypothetical protein [Parabacteroides sp. PF5-9]|uniref:hypothetical protein n=1 Tax=Parabacteroides sp. PF5-9 TaxID=1742404 RepID=UPI00247513AD|nr:hypothetical protein [Parabacteroides sp. PF5-9]MDH6357623.1 hypothetical protein [Parabacteroides sp. PF5-9]